MEELKSYMDEAYKAMEKVIRKQMAEMWEKEMNDKAELHEKFMRRKLARLQLYELMPVLKKVLRDLNE